MTPSQLLRRAVGNEPVPRDLHAKVRSTLEQRRWSLLPVFGAVIVTVGLLVAISQAYTTSMLRIGLEDHVHCALANAFPRQSGGSEMAEALGTQFAPLVQPISRHSGGLRLISAHRCDVAGRNYVHFVFEGADGLTSVSITKRRALEWIPGKRQSRIDGISVWGYLDEDYLVYISSASPKKELADALPQMLSYRL